MPEAVTRRIACCRIFKVPASTKRVIREACTCEDEAPFVAFKSSDNCCAEAFGASCFFIAVPCARFDFLMIILLGA